MVKNVDKNRNSNVNRQVSSTITFMQNVLKMFSLLTETFVYADFDFSSTFKDKLPFTTLIVKECIMFHLRRFYVIYLKVESSNIHI